MQRAQGINQQISRLREDIDIWGSIHQQLEDTAAMLELAVEEDEFNTFQPELEKELQLLLRQVEKLEFAMMLNGEHDENNAIVEIQAGAGGIDARDWANSLLRMYLRWAEKRRFETEIIEINTAEEAGINSATFLIKGKYAYGYMRAEAGVHRLVRLSPFDFNHRRHTSFASVSVTPEISDTIEVQINPDDLRIDTYRSGGAGGQHVNRTDSAVRITHIPTGITAQCQNERSQHRNRDTAMKVLRSRLYEYYRSQQNEELAKLKGERQDISFGSQIRSYTFHPYRLVKDLRTNVETGNVDAVMDGDIDPFIEAYLKML